MYRRARERIIAVEVMKLERRQAAERAARRDGAVAGPAVTPPGGMRARQSTSSRSRKTGL